METNFKAGYLGTSRPVDTIKAVITQSGLLQRTTFIARNLTPEGRMKNLEPISKRYLDDSFLIEYRKRIKKLAREFYDLYNQAPQKLIVDDSDTFNPGEMLKEFMSKQQEYVNRELVNKTVAEVMAGFIARESKHIIKLAYINAFYRKSSIVRKEHFEEAFEFMQTLFDYQVYWLEENLIEEREVREARSKLTYRLMAAFKNRDDITIKEIWQKITVLEGCSEPTARKKLKELTGKNKLFQTDNRKIYRINPDYKLQSKS